MGTFLRSRSYWNFTVPLTVPFHEGTCEGTARHSKIEYGLWPARRTAVTPISPPRCCCIRSALARTMDPVYSPWVCRAWQKALRIGRERESTWGKLLTSSLRPLSHPARCISQKSILGNAAFSRFPRCRCRLRGTAFFYGRVGNEVSAVSWCLETNRCEFTGILENSSIHLIWDDIFKLLYIKWRGSNNLVEIFKKKSVYVKQRFFNNFLS